MKLSYLAAAMVALVAPVAAQAGTVLTFNGTCATSATTTQAACTGTNGTYGNSATIAATNDATLKVLITGWQANQSTNAITSAFLGDYSGGFGVTGIQDQSGGGNLHQLDNVNGYTDFVLLQFSRAVHLEGFNLNLFQMTGVTGMDSDISVWNGSSITPATWNSAINLSSYAMNASLWSNTSGTSTAGYRDVAANGFSQVWLVSPSVLTSDRNDGFKLAGISVTAQIPAVPEPATWAMMIVGFGAIGASLRRRRRAAGAALLA